MRHRSFQFWMVALVVLSGCGSAKYEATSPAMVADVTESVSAESEQQTPASVSSVPRRIIYNGEIRLVVGNFSKCQDQLGQLVNRFEGYISSSTVDRISGTQRMGTWEVRVPAADFGPFLDAVAELGVPESRHQSAQDVTEEYVDLEARIANKQKLESRILTLLEESSGKITDVISVEKELARVRSEVEQMQGRLNYLTNQTQMSTVSVIVREEYDYVPPQAPTFWGRVQASFVSSTSELGKFFQQLLLAGVFALPWLLTALAGLLVLYYSLRWFIRHRSAR